MTDESKKNGEDKPEESGFENKEDMGIAQEFMLFLWENKLWWMLPIAIVFGLLILLMTFGSGAMAPFIYPI